MEGLLVEIRGKETVKLSRCSTSSLSPTVFLIINCCYITKLKYLLRHCNGDIIILLRSRNSFFNTYYKTIGTSTLKRKIGSQYLPVRKDGRFIN